MKSTSDDSKRFIIAYIALAGLVLIRFLPLLVGTKWLWGVGQLTLLPFGFWIGYGLLGGAILGLPLLSQTALWGEKLANWTSRTCYDSKQKYLARGVVLLIAAVAFYLFRMPTHFLGDGMISLANVASDEGHWIKWSEGGAIEAARLVRSILPGDGKVAALTAFQILSIFSGLIATWFYFLISEIISFEAVKRTLSFAVLFFSSSLLLYFGYVESYPIMWGPMAGFLYFSLTYSKEGKGAIPGFICLLLAIGLHLQTGMFVPAFGFVIFSRGAGLRLFQRFRPLILTALGFLIVGGGVLFYKKYTGNITVESVFLYPFAGKPAYPNYSMFSLRHWSDIFNLWLLVYPVGFAVLSISAEGARTKLLDRTGIYLGLLSIGSLLFLLLIDPVISMPRDWDLFASCWIAPTLLILHLVPDRTTASLQRLLPSLVAVSALLVVPWLMVNLDEPRGLAEMQQIIANNPEKSFGSMNLLGTYWQQKGEVGKAEENLRQSKQSFPDFYKIKDAFQMMADGHTEEAYRVFLQAKPDKFSKDYHSFLSGYYLKCRRPDDALAEARVALQLAPYFDRTYSLLAYAYIMKGDINEGIKALRQGYALNQTNKEFLTGLAQVNFNLKHYDSTLFYADKLHQADSVDPVYYFLCAKGYFGLNDPARAEKASAIYNQLGRGTAGFDQNCDDLRRVFQAYLRK